MMQKTAVAVGGIFSSSDNHPDNPRLRELRRSIAERLSRELEGAEAQRPEVERRASSAAAELELSPAARGELTEAITNEICGFGPIQPLLDDPSVTEIMVNRADRVYVERKGKPIRTNIVF